MDFVHGVLGFGGAALGYIVPWLFVLTVVVFFHELGHFLIGRLCGVAIETFSIGFGPELMGWHDRHGTRWRIGCLPLGGYVKFAGDRGPASTPDEDTLSRLSEAQRKRIFHFKPVWQRMAVVAAGPIANFILAIVIFSVMFMAVGQQMISPRVERVSPNSPAEAAGLEPGDLILSVDGYDISNFDDLSRIVATSADVPLKLVVRRGDSEVTLTATPKRHEVKDAFGNIQKIGQLGISRSMSPEDVKFIRMQPLAAVKAGVQETWFVVDRSLVYFWRMIAGQESADQLMGPVGIARISGQAAELGFVTLISLTALLSVSIGLINLFPVPLLDGGHLLYYGIEALRGRPLTAETQEFGFRIGLTAVISLFLFSTWNDLNHLRIVQFLTGLFS